MIDITHYLPHRAPMLMVDMISVMDDTTVETLFEIRTDSIFLHNHSLTEAGLVENAAQTCSSIVGKDYFVDENNQDRAGVAVVGFISAIKSIKIYALPMVGSTIVTRAALVSKFVTDHYTLCTMDFHIFNGAQLLSEGSINLMIQPISN